MPFAQRHIGLNATDVAEMLSVLGLSSLDEMIEKVVPAQILDRSPLNVPNALSEEDALAELLRIAQKNQLKRSFIGQGYSNTHTPQVVLRNVLLNPGWYTAYTPYQPEISQGRLEVLFNFQTMVTELTGMAIANASMLDEGTAAAEAMTMMHRASRGKKNTLLVSRYCHPQTIDVINTRAKPLDIKVTLIDERQDPLAWDDVFGVLLQYPATDGGVEDYAAICSDAHANKALVTVAADLLALTLLPAPGSFGADIVVGNSQRFGVPLGMGGPHAAFFATADKYKRNMPGRLVGQSIDSNNQSAYRLALQTREQHIRRDKATSNICTAQALLAMMATLYACYHGPAGLRDIARGVHSTTAGVAGALKQLGFSLVTEQFFDTITVKTGDKTQAIASAAVAAGMNLRVFDDAHLAIALDETVSPSEAQQIVDLFAAEVGKDTVAVEFSGSVIDAIERNNDFMTQPAFNQFHTETEMMRYLRRLADKDIALDRAMIPLGSCTMKLNAAAEMAPVTWPEFANVHPFVPADQRLGYVEMIEQVEEMLCACTGYAGVSLQPNAGSQGEYAGLLAIKRYLESKDEGHRDVCLIPSSAHGTNPASAQLGGMKVVVVACDEQGNIDVDDLKEKIAKHEDRVAAIMITYPSTHGVFEARVTEVCELVHQAGGQVYVDGANLNAMIGNAQPGQFGGDVSHLNLHKTFAIPHGGGGPGIGPVAVAEHLVPFLPGHRELDDTRQGDAVSAAPYGSAGVVPITWMYLRMMGPTGLADATTHAILSANYIAKRLSDVYDILYQGENGFVAHECIVDTRPLKDRAGVTVDDIAKRLIDFGFHAPTMSFPVAGTLMVEPTESESKYEVDRFCDAMLAIYEEFKQIEAGEVEHAESALAHAPHTAEVLLQDQWSRPYSRQQAAYPYANNERMSKYWPPVGRVDNVYGDKNLVCSCPPLSAYEEA